ncbi:MAG TPA: hypothetical protein VE890_11480 [Thermoguttaceae bacterium]|nr:hypothetical protein [Thermoguttaceae bacterium]
MRKRSCLAGWCQLRVTSAYLTEMQILTIFKKSVELKTDGNAGGYQLRKCVRQHPRCKLWKQSLNTC